MLTHRRRAALLASLSVIGLAASGCHSSSSPSGDGSSSDGKAVATVNGQSITQPQFYEALQTYIPSPQGQSQTAGRSALTMLITNLIVEQTAQQQGVPVTDAQVDERYNEFVLAQDGNSTKTLEQQLTDAGMTPEDFKAQRLKPEIAQLNLVAKGVPPPTDAEVQDFYQKHQASFTKPDRAKIRVIVFASADEAKNAAADIQKGGSFDAHLPQSLNRDWENGQFPNWVPTDGSTPPQYAPIVKAINATDAGNITAPVSLNGVWWLVQVQEKRKKEVTPFDKVKEMARFQVLQQKIQTDPGKFLNAQQQIRLATQHANITVTDPRYQSVVKAITAPAPSFPAMRPLPPPPAGAKGGPAPKAKR